MMANEETLMEQGQPLLSLHVSDQTDSIQETNLESPSTESRARIASNVIPDYASSMNAVGLLLLSILPRWILPGQSSNKIHPTSWLDALRGYAAWSVVNHHAFAFKDLRLFHLPFFNCFVWGQPAVDVFFVISGYVLTQRMLQQIRAQQGEKLSKSLTSSLFRRWVRLFVPCAVVTFIAMLLIHYHLLPGHHVDGFWDQVWHWGVTFVKWCDPLAPLVGFYDTNSINPYIQYLWTIPVEYRGSLTTFLFVAATSRLRSLHRLLLGAFLVVTFFWMQSIHGALFLSGTCLAEVSLRRFPERYTSATLLESDVEVGAEKSPSKAAPSIYMRVLFVSTLVIGLFLSGFTGYSEHQPRIYSFLQPVTPREIWDGQALRHFWPSIAAPMMVWSIDSWKVLQQPFNSRFSQVLGQLSFGLYVMQQLVQNSLYLKLLYPLLKSCPTGVTWWAVACFDTLIYWLAVAWVADYFDRVDKWIVRGTRSLQERLFLDW